MGVLLVIMIRLGGNVWRLWKAGERIHDAESVVRSQELENQELKKRLVQVQSPEFIEKEAREKLGLGEPLPSPSNPKPQIPNPNVDIPNWQKWWKLYIGD